MAGILDSKTRIMDVIITNEGRRQMTSGRLRAEFISFTDSQAFYEKSLASGSTDASKRIYFEATSKLQDSIVLETDDSGNLMQFDFSPKHTLIGDQLFTVTDSSPDLSNYQFLLLNTGSSFASVGSMLVTASINNFKNQLMIGTRNGVDADLPGDGFTLDKQSISFKIQNYSPFSDGAWHEKINIDAIEPIFIDKRLSHLPNFKFLSPITSDGDQLGDYINLNEKPPLTFEELENSLGLNPVNTPGGSAILADIYATQPAGWAVMPPDGWALTPPGLSTSGESVPIKLFQKPTRRYGPRKEKHVINFKSTSMESNIVMQMFELSNDAFKKLDVIDFGIFNDTDDKQGRIEKHVFFIGKVYIDSTGTPTFVNLFTIIMD
jgi:hypothetical protein